MSAPPPPPPPPTLTVRTPSPPKSWFGGTSSPAATAATAPPPPPSESWYSRFTQKKPKPNWTKFTTGPNGSKDSPSKSNNTTKKNNSKKSFFNAAKVAAREQQRQGFLANVKKGLTNERSIHKANTKENYEGNGYTQTRKEEKMKETSDSNRIDRLLALFKAALNKEEKKKKENSSIDILQYIYVLTTNPASTDEKKDFIKIMESLEAFPKETEYNHRIAMLTEEFIKTHRLEHIGMKIDRDRTEKGGGVEGTNIQHYKEYNEDELNKIITKYKQTIFDDVLGLFIILTMYLLCIFTTGDTYAFDNEELLKNIKMLISLDPEKDKQIANSFKQIRTSQVSNYKNHRDAGAVAGVVIGGGMGATLGAMIYGIISGAMVIGLAAGPIGLAVVIGIAGLAGTIAAVGGTIHLISRIRPTASKMYRVRYDVPKNKMDARELLVTLYSLLLNPGNETYVGSSELRFTKEDYDFLKEFDMMFSGWYTDTELYNFIYLFTRKRLKMLLGDAYNQIRKLPEGWHEFKTDREEVYYNSNEYSKNELKTLDRYKLTSWVMPMVPFVKRRNYNDNITIYPPSDFTHEPRTPTGGQGQIKQTGVHTNSRITTPEELEAARAAAADTAITPMPATENQLAPTYGAIPAPTGAIPAPNPIDAAAPNPTGAAAPNPTGAAAPTGAPTGAAAPIDAAAPTGASTAAPNPTATTAAAPNPTGATAPTAPPP